MKGHKALVITAILIILSLLASGLTLSGCDSYPHGGKISVIATIFPLGNMVKELGGDRVDVTILLPSGASPHTYEPLPSQVEELAKARLCLKVGLGLDFWIDKLIASADNRELKVIDLGEGIDSSLLLPSSEVEGTSEWKYNPHIWLDPAIAAEIARSISRALTSVDPENKEEYDQRLEAYLGELDHLKGEVESLGSKVNHKEVVTFHSAFAYLLRRAGLSQSAVIEEFPGKEPTAQYIEKVVNTIKSLGIPVVFAEPQFNPKAAQVIAEEAGVDFRTLDPLGDPADPERDSYLKVIRYNLHTLEESLQ